MVKKKTPRARHDSSKDVFVVVVGTLGEFSTNVGAREVRKSESTFWIQFLDSWTSNLKSRNDTGLALLVSFMLHR